MKSKRDAGLAAVVIVAKTAMPLILDFFFRPDMNKMFLEKLHKNVKMESKENVVASLN